MIKGMITSVGQLGQPVGKWQYRYQDITVTTDSGETVTGNIGSKLPNGYVVDTPISVEVTQDPQYGTKFRVFDPNRTQTTYSKPTVKPTTSNPVSSIVSTNVQIIRQCCIKAAARISAGDNDGDFAKLAKYTIAMAKDFEAYVLGRPVENKGGDIPF
ncbi:hypothetical protein LCGC14_2442490 [marine sediment metagenome]|uniref:Uncharacterized protein n=1 Tax=marine sediment metagenome TaxID=412755 RepID=A0A0F9BIN0_9ZZZZ